MTSVDPANVTATRKEPDETDLAKAGLLSLLAEDKPYLFITAEHGTDSDGEFIQVNAATDINDPVVLRFVLESALARLGEVVTE